MHDRLNALLGDDLRHQIAVGNIAFIKRDIVGHGEFEPGRQVVDHRHRPAGIAQGQHCMATDVAGTAGHKDGNLRYAIHAPAPSRSRGRRNRCGRKLRSGAFAACHAFFFL